jgi:hypothetical protein
MSDSSNQTIAGTVTFIQNAVPALESGEYEIRVTQKIAGAHAPKGGHVNAVAESFQTVARFTVRGERFALAPAELHSVFPADNAVGEYENVLPHAVLTRKTLPWERTPLATGLPGGDGRSDVPAWLAVLLIDENDIDEYPAFNPVPRTVTVGDLFKPAVHPASSLGGGCSYFDHAASADNELDVGESLADLCTVIDLPLPLFRAVAPAVDDLKMLAHVRDVSVANHDKAPSSVGAQDAGTGFSIVIGNRLPVPGRKSYAYLVSLENLDGQLPGGADASVGAPAGAFLRLAVLKNWSFTAVPDAQGSGFVNLLKAVNVDLLRLSGKADAPAQVKDALARGYVAFNHEMRGGSRGVSWYRGPLIPGAKRMRTLKTPVPSADAATRYDPDLGMLDVSYSAAWQLGRLLALQDKAYSTALYNWKREIERQLLAEVEGDLIHTTFAPILTGNPAGNMTATLVSALTSQPILGGKS